MFKKWLAILLALLLTFTSAVSFAEDFFFDDEDEAMQAEKSGVYTGPAYDYTSLTVGNTTALSGGFSNRIWGSNTSDMDVSALVNGYNLVNWDYEAGCFTTDPTVVTGLTVSDDAQGNRIYSLALDYDDLKYSDGTPINAYDYAFNILMHVSKQAEELGGSAEWYQYILGVKDYREGKTDTLAGVTVPNEDVINITVSSEFRPFFYELGYLWCYPVPIHVVAPGCKVVDEGRGCRIEGPFTTELFSQTMLDPNTGYRTYPSVVAGPYKLTSFDGVTAEFEINPEYKGNKNGEKPTIEHLIYTLTDNENAVQDLSTGKLGLINKAVSREMVEAGMELLGTGNFAMGSYPRIGESHISFCCEKDTVSSNAVRQAIAYCLDKDQLVQSYTGYNGIRVDGYYGIGQWMYQVLTGAVQPPIEEPDETASAADVKAYEDEMAEWAELSMASIKVYDLDIAMANALLDQDGWTLNTDGNTYRAGTDEIRCKMIDGNIVKLDLSLVYPEGNEIATYLDDYFIRNLAQAGIRLTLVPTEMNELRALYHRDTARDCDMLYLATNYDEVFEPSPSFDPKDAVNGKTNFTAIDDQKLYDLALDMSCTDPGEPLLYVQKWIKFQEQFEETLPLIPVYGNAYFDFYTKCLQEYHISQNVTWTESIVPAYMSDPMIQIEAE